MVVLVTGARSGFGRLASRELAKRGHTVFAGLRDVSTAESLLEGASGDIRPIALDVTKPEERQAAVRTIVDATGRIDGLVNNAGIGLAGFLEDVSAKELQRLYDVNVFGVHGMTQAVLPTMRAQKAGAVVMVSSMAGRAALPGLGAYASSKFALEGMSEAWRHELRPFGIAVTLIEPGPYKTDIFERNRNVAKGAESPDSAYVYYRDRLEVEVSKAAQNAGDPQDVAMAIADAVEGKRTGLRHTMGPNNALRRVAGMLPFVLTEWVIQRRIMS